MMKPSKLKRGDTIAAVSLSWGGAGDDVIIDRYFKAKKRLKEVFGLHVIEMAHTLKGSRFLYEHPELRAEDLMAAFKAPEVRAIFSTIGGDDTLRLLPYIDFEVIKNNPKIFMGYSDTTVNHFMCYKADLVSFYGPCMLMEFAENVALHDYTKAAVFKALFEDGPQGEILPSAFWTSERLPWDVKENNFIKRRTYPNRGYEVVQGIGTVEGHLIGGCIEVLDWLRGTTLWPEIEAFRGGILFLETSEEMPTPSQFKYLLRNLMYAGIIDVIAGIILGKPHDEKYIEEYKSILRTLMIEAEAESLPILYNLNFGHTSPMTILPYGVKGKIDCDKGRFCLLESGVV